MRLANLRPTQCAIVGALLALSVSTVPVHAAEPSPFVGSWTGVWGANVATTELRITAIADDGTVYGTYCHFEGGPFSVSDLHPDGQFQARLKAGAIKFETASGRKKWSFAYNSDRHALDLTYRSKKGRTHTLQFNPVAGPCLSRVQPLPGPVA